MTPDEHRFFAGVILDSGDYLIETPAGQQAFTRAAAEREFVDPKALRSDAQQVVFEAIPVDEIARIRRERDALRAQLSEAVGLLKGSLECDDSDTCIDVNAARAFSSMG